MYVHNLCYAIAIISAYIKLPTRIHNTLFAFPQADPTDLESIVSSTRSEYDLSTQRLSIDRNMEIIIQIDSDRSSPHDKGNLSRLGAIKSERLTDAFEIVSQEQPSTFFFADSLPTTVPGTSGSQPKNHLTETDRHIDEGSKDIITNKISRIIRDREHILGKEISRTVQEVDTTSIPDRAEFGITGLTSTKEEGEDLMGNATQATVHETTRDQSHGTGKSNTRFSRMNMDGATTAVALVAIGAIMLLVGPIVIILRILDERRQARKLIALPANAREDLPPTYEQAVLMDEAPRYSTLALNYDRTPPSSPTLSSTYTFSNVAT